MIRQIVLPSKIDVFTERQEIIDFFNKTQFYGIRISFFSEFSFSHESLKSLENNSVFIDPKISGFNSSLKDFLQNKYSCEKMHFIMPQDEVLSFIKLTQLPEAEVIPIPCDNEIFKKCNAVFKNSNQMDFSDKNGQAEQTEQYEDLIPEIDGNSNINKILKSKLLLAAKSELPVLLLGESGTGKSYAASIIHALSKRRNKIFNVLDIGTVSESIADTELFGSSYGAFTGAVNSKGLLLESDGGTLFIDEIGNASLAMQAKLLRFTETGKIRAVGSSKETQVDTRLIFATNINLASMVKQMLFRADFYNRINVFTIEFEPLRNHIEDVKNITETILRKNGFCITQRAISVLESYNWPGNIRELKNCLSRAMLFCKNKKIEEQDIIFC